MSKNWNKVTIEANLISLPDIYWRLKEILDTHDYSLQDISQLIVYDPGLTARMLRIVNSAYFGFAEKIDTVSHAVSILGVQQVQDLILTTSIADALGDYECEHLDVKQFWLHSVYRAIAARNLAGEFKLIDCERMFVAGLLSGIGHLIMYQSVPVLAQRAQRVADESGEPLYLAEQGVIGFDHARVAAMLMQNWNLSESHVAIIKNHLELDPEAGYFLEASIVHIAALIGNAFAENLPLDEVLVRADNRAWDATGLDTGHCEAIDVVVAEQLNGVVNMLFPKMQCAAV
ncbi:MAG: HDOD domain-containing protein [Gammaproteobacteria bacterium]|nr:HDOD domain-containing protein [Gammaproteobacteria bacterium]